MTKSSGSRLLQHQPLRAHVVPGVAPVAQRVQVAEVQALFEALVDAREPARDLARDERLAADRRLVIEQDAAAGVEAVGLPVVDGDPVRVDLGRPVRGARIERRRLPLRRFLHLAEHLGRRRLVEARLLLEPEDADGLEDPQRAERVGVRGVLRRLERHRDVALRGEVVDLVGLDLLDHADQVRGVGEVAVVQVQPGARDVRVLVEVVDAVGVEQRRAALDAVHLVALAHQQFGEVGAVLPCNAGDQSRFLQDHLLP